MGTIFLSCMLSWNPAAFEHELTFITRSRISRAVRSPLKPLGGQSDYCITVDEVEDFSRDRIQTTVQIAAELS
jgi:hypothetical protein